MPISQYHHDLIVQYNSSYHKGLTTQEASERRSDSDGLNCIDPPIKCPKWVCCLLPCINHTPSMKQFRLVQPDDAEVLRDGNWIRYDAASLVIGDIVRLVEGDVVPADCVVISLGMDHVEETAQSIENGSSADGVDSLEMTVDSHFITGESKPRRISVDANRTAEPATLYYGSRILEGACVALVVQTGKRVLLAHLISQGRWPPKHDLTEEVKSGDFLGCDDEGISLISVT
ncbi:hypothetical protein HJC23_000537 [Cyclotella cryptica]|uniref:P-type ATPase A domain-containing protein n=1 Tax=Cyclotella cryptica TaxID=29204 RepID=A0ABD3NK59_9STRA|eukprot:CCRYP_020687-RA/>CCRYP_020687-RA protein AED:0.02 eAED:0.02 QI:96/1/1/1/1/1/2/1075/230